MGMAASMGQFLLSAGAKGKRYALPHARIMMHQPLGGIGGGAADIEIQAEQIAATSRSRCPSSSPSTPASRSSGSSADSDRDRWFTAEEALEYGFVDHVVTPRRTAAAARPTT